MMIPLRWFNFIPAAINLALAIWMLVFLIQLFEARDPLRMAAIVGLAVSFAWSAVAIGVLAIKGTNNG